MKSSGGRVEVIDADNYNEWPLTISDLLDQSKIHHGEINILQEKLIKRLLDEKILIRHLNDCAEHITVFKNDSEGYVLGLIKCVDVCSSDELWSVYKSFVYQLVTAHPKYTENVLRYHIHNFKTINGAENNEDLNMVTDHVHNLISNIMIIVPMSYKQVLDITCLNYPFHTLPLPVQLSYLNNVLTLATTHTQLRYHLLKLIINKLIKLDLLSPRNEVTEAEENCGVEESQFSINLDEVSAVDPCAMAHETADKLDTLLEVVFSTLTEWITVEGEVSPELTNGVYMMIREIFDEEILCVREAQHVPFIVFYIISKHETLPYDFLEYLWGKIANPFTPQSVRENAAAYLASLVARAEFFRMRFVVRTLASMVEWIDSYINQYTDDRCKSTAPQFSRHVAFYSVCQAVFYIIAFRNKQLTSKKQRVNSLLSLNLDRIIQSRLNPLAVVDPVILRNFAAITRHHQILYCYSVIEHNTRCNYDTKTLQAYFPFDKYILKRSSHWMEGLLKVYDGAIIDVETKDDCRNAEDGEDDFLSEDMEIISPADDVLLSRTRHSSFTDNTIYNIEDTGYMSNV